MKDRLQDVDDAQLRRALRAWDIDAVSLTYAPVGFGDHHWTATDAGRRRWFVTVADLAHKPHCGAGPEAAFDGLRRAMDTAAALADGGPSDHGLGDTVVAPLRSAGGGTLRRLGGRYAVSVFPYVDGAAGDFGDRLTGRERRGVLDVLAELHRTPPPADTPEAPLGLPARAQLDDCLASLDRPWEGGPYAEPARVLVARHEAALRRRLAEFDRSAAALDARAGERVVTHGEPHPGNLLRRGDRLHLVDWDTVGRGLPERDLWHVATDPGDLEYYAAATGHHPDQAAIDFFRLRWALDDVAEFLADFRSAHGRTPDADESWEFLSATLAELARQTCEARRPPCESRSVTRP